VDQLSGLLPHDTQWNEWAGRMYTGLLFEFAPSGSQQVLAWLGDAFWNGPGAIIAPFPEGTARVCQEELESAG
jgi:hypothetical protein